MRRAHEVLASTVPAFGELSTPRQAEFATIASARDRLLAPGVYPERPTMDEIDEEQHEARRRTARFGLVVSLLEIVGTLIGGVLVATRVEWPNPLVPIGIVVVAVVWSAFRFLRHVRQKY
jgi:hypothetical protein